MGEIVIAGVSALAVCTLAIVVSQAVQARSAWRKDRELERVYREWQRECTEALREGRL